MVRAMSTPHKATPEQWRDAGAFASDTRACLLELRARVEALEREAAMDELRAASAEARPAVKARITRDRDETGDYIIIHDASPPAGSLVERVAEAMAAMGCFAPDEGCGEEARAVLRVVAAWLRDRKGIQWAWVARILELEADR